MKKPTRKLQKQPTMRDVAQLAGVSQPTVSRVLNQTDTSIAISDETRAKVMAAIEELNYRPNILARGLRTQKTQMLAVLIADISNSFYPPIARSIQDVATDYGYDVMIANSDHLYNNEIHFCEAVSRRPVDGTIMVPIHLTTADLESFSGSTNTPLAVLADKFDHPYIDVVYVEDEIAVYETTSWLITERGHRRLGLVGVPDDLPPGPRRLRGFSRALEEFQLTFNPRHVVQGDFSLESGQKAALELLETEGLPSAIVVMNDLMAIGVMLTLQEAGYRIPEDVAIVGFDDIPEASLVRPGLTTIAQDSVDIGRKLAKCIFSRIEDPTLPQRQIKSPTRLIIRGSA